MDLFFNIIIFVLGLMVGSFLNCVIYRLEQEKRFFKGRSYCPDCKHQLRWPDLIPVLSFLSLRGRCRYCQKKISWQYPIVEISTAAIFFLIFNFQLSIFNYLILPFLIVIFVYDLKYYLIPDKVIYPAIGMVLVYDFLKSDIPGMSDFLISAFGAAAFFLFIVLISKGKWMGIGDIKLAFLMGLVLGWPNILAALFLAFMSGAMIGIGLIFLGKKTLKSEVPFGPFLVAGTFISLFFGKIIINWYSHFLW
ncbi:MAG: hypothetical protein A2896_01230 [Candidatus Nealsonbacteria bacterium RIFCSPLOWO2_01_FULL_43_32]|uniref:Prepilin leader peptidase/N-methyltransferase n=1 Tax=Candidatus Nealsonbacteria bacterium RIFCSPLOWO2_01_FULL_43_32 TaxID=1801672 RepID=A0A1G2EGD5_9BACT|nr:MAG: hypothetical protein A2896_01230 [Candidatus Nealsonbacteria bacterium RIFCSPLOWO2_01_FULL_43_32]